MNFEVVFAAEADEDLSRLYNHLPSRAQDLEDLETAERAIDAVEAACAALALSPLLFPRSRRRGALRRELVVPFGASGYVIEYEIAGPTLVVVLAVRHHREQDYH